MQIYNNFNLTSLPKLRDDLTCLYCNKNRLKELGNLSSSIKLLDCSENEITELINLPENLELLFCNDNKLTILKNLPKSLKILNCSNNNITEIELPPKLETLQINYNNLKFLPALPSTFQHCVQRCKTPIIDTFSLDFCGFYYLQYIFLSYYKHLLLCSYNILAV